MKVELRHLRYFVAVAEELHFGRAARRLGLAQPPLSQQIRQLEDELGCRLLERRPRVRLTPAGEALLDHSRRALGDVERALAAVRDAGAGRTGTLSIGFPASALLTGLPSLIQDFRAAFPDVRLDLRELSSADQLVALKEHRIDVAFLREAPADDASLRCDVVVREPFVVVAPSAHPISSRDGVRLAALALEAFVLFPPEVAPALHRQVHSLFRQAGFEPRVAQSAAEWLTIVGLVESGVGLSVVPASFRKLGWGSVKYLDLQGEQCLTTISICRLREAPSAAAGQFVERALQRMAG